MMITTRPLNENQRRHLALAALGWFTLRVERTCPSLERRGLVERYRHTEHGRSHVDWRITVAGRAMNARLHYDPEGQWPVYCAYCGMGLPQWYYGGHAPACPRCHHCEGPVLHPARWEINAKLEGPAARAVWEEWAAAA